MSWPFLTGRDKETYNWNSFRHTAVGNIIPRMDCATARHRGREIGADWFELVWTPNEINVTQSIVHAGWYTCESCHQEMVNRRREQLT